MAVTSRKIRRAAGTASPAVGLNDPTAERQRRDTFQTIPAPRMPDEQIGRDRIERTRKQVCRIARMEREGTLTRDQAAALQRYELMAEQAGYDRGRSCLGGDVRTGSSGGVEAIMDIRAMARQRLARARNAAGDTVALMFVDAVLWPLSGENFGDVADRLLTGAGGREARRALGRKMVAEVADALLVCFNR